MAGFKFQRYDLGRVERGATVIVTLSTGANVRLMSPSEFSSYQHGRRHRYIGGLATRSPVRLAIPSTGHWMLTIDLQGLRATTIRSSVRVEPPPLPRLSNELSDVRTAAREALTPDASGRTWDVFISHAHEDKHEVAEPLAEALRGHGLKVWIDSAELRIGDSLRRRIDDGLAHSAFGVVVLSNSFFAKGWAQYELDGLVGLNLAGKQQMLPIWHNISKDEVLSYAPSLADRVARTTATSTLSEIAAEIATVVGDRQSGVDAET